MLGRTNALTAGGSPVPPTPVVTKPILTVYDFDGTVLYEAEHEAGETVQLPTPPTHPRITFKNWVCTSELYNDNVVLTSITMPDHDTLIGPLYTVDSGYTELDVEIPSDNFQFMFFQYTGTIDWGDGTVETYDSTNGHTYATKGNYTIKVTLNTNYSSNTKLFYNTSANTIIDKSKYTLKHVRSAVDNYWPQGCFHNCYNLEDVSCMNGLFVGYTFYGCRNLKFMITRGNTYYQSATFFSNGYDFYDCHVLKAFVWQKNSIGPLKFTFNNCYSLKKFIWVNGTQAYTATNRELSSAFQFCYQLKYVYIAVPGNQVFSSSVFSGCNSLEDFKWGNTPRFDIWQGSQSQQFGGCYRLKQFKNSINMYNIPNGFLTKTFMDKEFIVIATKITGNPLGEYNNCYTAYPDKMILQAQNTNLEISAICTSSYVLKEVAVAEGTNITMTSNHQSQFYECRSIEKIDQKILDAFTSLVSSEFYNCMMLPYLKFNGNITAVNGSYVFLQCRRLKYIWFHGNTQVASLNNQNSLSSSFCKIIVPDSLYDLWIASTNWVAFADRIVRESDWQGD